MSTINFTGSVEFQQRAFSELDWEHSHAHWLIEEYSDYVFNNELSIEEALQEWRQFLNDEMFGTLTPDQARIAEK